MDTQPTKRSATVFLWAAVLVAVILVIAWYVNFMKRPPMMASFDDKKIVYTTNVSQPSDQFERDCKRRGGNFRECGTICAPDAQMCATVCAFTCELTQP